MKLTEIMLPPPSAEEAKLILLKNAKEKDIKRAAAYYKVLRYVITSYSIHYTKLYEVLADNPNPLVTPYGILYKNKNEFEQVYDGIHFPEYYWEENMGTVALGKDGFAEYLYLPYVETELTKALERLRNNFV